MARYVEPPAYRVSQQGALYYQPRPRTQGRAYGEQLRRLSWVPEDVPSAAQPSAGPAVEAGKYNSLHPCTIQSTEPFVVKASNMSYLQTRGVRSNFIEADYHA